MADLMQNTAKPSGGGGFMDSPWAMILPVVLGAASILSPRIGQGVGAALQGLEWMDKRQKEKRRLSSLEAVGNVASQATAGGEFPGLDKLIAASGGNLDATLPFISRMAELGRPQVVHLPGGGIAQAKQTPSGGMTLSDLRQGQMTEQDIAKSQLPPGASASDVLAQMERNKLDFQRRQQEQHITGSVNQANQMLPIKEKEATIQANKQVDVAARMAPIHTKTQVNTAEGLLGPQKKHAQDVQTIKSEAELKPSPAWLTSIDKQIGSIDNRLNFSMPELTSEEKASLIEEKQRLGELRSHILLKASERLGMVKKGEPAAAPAAAPPAGGNFAQPTAADLADYQTVMQNGNQAQIKSAQTKALKAWGKLPK